MNYKDDNDEKVLTNPVATGLFYYSKRIQRGKSNMQKCKSSMNNRLNTNPNSCPHCSKSNINKSEGTTLKECISEVEKYWNPIANVPEKHLTK
ncbi:MAG: hypothetical protein FWD82_08155 [Defluviitaleaceae bacterium]|nr:hypothetical protein [Defluviitaleaceae bacterium]